MAALDGELNFFIKCMLFLKCMAHSQYILSSYNTNTNFKVLNVRASLRILRNNKVCSENFNHNGNVHIKLFENGSNMNNF